MTIEELYQWAKVHKFTDYEVNIECYDEDGDVSEVWLDDVCLLEVHPYRHDILIKCAEQKRKLQHVAEISCKKEENESVYLPK